MELRHLNAYVAVAKELHFTRAARRLFMSQSALSRLIHNLEAELGVMLLDRSTRHVTLTPAGNRFLHEARLALAQVDAAVRAAQNPGTSGTAALRVGYCDATELALVDALQCFHKRHPEVELSLHELDRNDLFGARPSEAWDLALCRERVNASHTTSEHVRDERLSLWLPDAHPLAGRPSLTLSDLRGDTLLIMPKGLLVDVRTALPPSLQRRSDAGPVQDVPTFAAAVVLVSAGLGVTVVPRSMSATLGVPGVVCRPLTGQDMHLPVFALRRRDKRCERVMALMRALCEAPSEPEGTDTATNVVSA